VIDLEIASVHHKPRGRTNGQADRIGDGVVDAERRHIERPELDGPARRDRLQAGTAPLFLIQFGFDESASERGRVYGCRDLVQQKGQASDVILVAVCHHDATNPWLVLHQVAQIGDDGIHAEHLFTGKLDAHVHDEDLLTVLQERAVSADAAEASQRYQLEFSICHCYLRSLPFYT